MNDGAQKGVKPQKSVSRFFRASITRSSCFFSPIPLSLSNSTNFNAIISNRLISTINNIAILYFHRVKHHELQSLNLFLFVPITLLYDSIFWAYRNSTTDRAGCERTVASIYRYRMTRMTIKAESLKDSLKEFRTSFKMIKTFIVRPRNWETK